MKKFIMGFVSASILFCGISFAEEAVFQLKKVDYKIYVDGKELKTDLPVLNYNGNTYVPFRTIGESTGAKIEWFSDVSSIFVYSKVPEAKTVVKEVPKEVIKEVVKEVDKSNAEYTTFSYNNGDTFTGFVNKNNGDKFGTFTSKDGIVYKGEIKNNNFNGIGKITLDDKSSYIGHFYEGKRVGTGVIMDSTGNIIMNLYSASEETGTSYIIAQDNSQIVKASIYNSQMTDKKQYLPQNSYSKIETTPQNSQTSQLNLNYYNIEKSRLDSAYSSTINSINSNYDKSVKTLKENMNARGIWGSSIHTDSLNELNEIKRKGIEEATNIYNQEIKNLKLFYNIQ